MTEKLASAEIDESRKRFRKYLVDQPWPFDRQAVIAAMQWAERDTRERCAQHLRDRADELSRKISSAVIDACQCELLNAADAFEG